MRQGAIDPLGDLDITPYNPTQKKPFSWDLRDVCVLIASWDNCCDWWRKEGELASQKRVKKLLFNPPKRTRNQRLLELIK